MKFHLLYIKLVRIARIFPGIILFLWITSSCALYSQDANPEASSNQSNKAEPLVLHGVFPWDDPVKPLSVKRNLTPQEQDKAQAQILFSVARDLERRSEVHKKFYGDDFPNASKNSERIKYTPYQKRLLEAQALKKYQRAARLDPNTTTSIRIVEMACLREQYDLAARYIDEMYYQGQPVGGIDPMLLRQLASRLIRVEAVDEAYKLYKSILEKLGSRFDPQAVVLNYETARCAYLAGDYTQASDCFEFVYRAAKDPKEFGLSPRLIDILEIEKADTLRLVADAFLMDKRYERAELFFEMADKLNKNTPVLSYHKARIALAKEDYDAAKKYLVEALKGDLSGEGQEPMFLMEELVKKINQPELADQTLQGIVSKIAQKIQTLQKNKALSGMSKKILTNFDDDVWEYYCDSLAKKDKKSEAIKQLKRYYNVKPNRETLDKIIQYQLEAGLFSDAFDAMARLFKATGNIKPFIETTTKFLEDDKNRQSFVAAAADAQNRILKDAADNGYNVGKGWSVFHAGAVSLSLMSAYQKISKPNQTTAPDDASEDKPESPQIAELRQFVDYAMSKGVVPKYTTKRQNAVESVLSKASQLLSGNENESDDNLVLPPGEFNGQNVGMTWGVCLMRDSQYASAVKAFENVKKWLPNQRSVNSCDFCMAGALVLNKQYDKAMERIDSCLKSDPNDIEFLVRKAWLLHLANRTDESEALYEKIIADNIDNYEDAWVQENVSEARHSLAGIYDLRCADPNLDDSKKHEYQIKSMELLEQVLDEHPGSLVAMNSLAFMQAEQNVNLHRAEKMSRRTLEEEPENCAYLDTLGWIEYRLQKYDEAIDLIQRSLNGLKDPVVYDHLGDVYAAKNDMENAVSAWKKALDALDAEAEKSSPHLRAALEKKLNSVHPPSEESLQTEPESK
ncbi:MAG: tetratricopeptide repeat protein [Thermoguttaceae bacterium]|nr:tetratricopeptide repeat protein [Thermoguttaceae bacterium]